MDVTIQALVQRFKNGRCKLQANPTILDASIANLSVPAQVPAMKFRDLMLSSENDLTKFYAASGLIMRGLPDDVIRELEEHKHEIAKILGVPMGALYST